MESDDEEEHFPGFGDLHSTNGTTGKQQETETNPFLGSFDGGLLNGKWGGLKMLYIEEPGWRDVSTKKRTGIHTKPRIDLRYKMGPY